MEGIRFLPVGDRALTVEFGHGIEESINRRVRQLSEQLKQIHDPAFVEMTPTFRSLLICYDPTYRNYESMCRRLEEILSQEVPDGERKGRILKVPVCYGARFGVDLGELERLLHLDRDEIIAIHSGRDYRIYMLGFLPGFAYLGGLDERIACPRLARPRTKIAPGSVGIGGSQTGVYPLESPGGWRLIGRTPIDMYDPGRENPIPVRAGDWIRFVPIGLEEWYEIRRAVSRREYRLEFVQEDPGKEEEPAPVPVFAKPGKRRMRLRVNRAGAMTTVQDAGRYGGLELGITRSGAMDREAYDLANRLVENEGNEAVLEMTVTGGSFCVEGRGRIAVTGADMQPTLNGRPLPMNRAVEVRDGDEVALGTAVNGCRSYLAVSGGFDVPPALGSRSTNVRCGMGGFCGRALRAGDVLDCAEPPLRVGDRQLGTPWKPYPASAVLRFVPGPQEDMFSEKAMEDFINATYRVDSDSDRMGYRLDGPAVELKPDTEMISDGVVSGSIQIPPGGRPIVMMADHQTTGGYAKIGTVISEDLGKLAQLMPGAEVRFRKISVEEAQKLLERRELGRYAGKR